MLRTFAICMQLFPYLFILLFGKIAGATFPDPKETGIEIKLHLQVIVMPNGQLNVRQAKNE